MKMFGIFKKKTELELLQEKYRAFLELSHKLSTSDRAASDKAFAQAQAVLEQIESLEKT